MKCYYQSCPQDSWKAILSNYFRSNRVATVYSSLLVTCANISYATDSIAYPVYLIR